MYSEAPTHSEILGLAYFQVILAKFDLKEIALNIAQPFISPLTSA
jgi:hypothetical protein